MSIMHPTIITAHTRANDATIIIPSSIVVVVVVMMMMMITRVMIGRGMRIIFS